MIISSFSAYSLGQDTLIFRIDTIQRNQAFNEELSGNFDKLDSNFFEDSNYIFRRSCSGEWGGSLFIIDKLTGKKYECAATCPVIVNRFKGSYYLTTTLAHGCSFSEIIKISDPTALKEVVPVIKKRNNKKQKVRPISEKESHSVKGTTSLMDTTFILTVASFVYNDALYHITTDHKTTYVSEIQNNELINIQTVDNKSIWCYEPEPFITSNGHLILIFRNEKVRGYLDIFKNLITIHYYQ